MRNEFPACALASNHSEFQMLTTLCAVLVKRTGN